ncbi:potassium ion transporter [Cryptococcus wingfieldii CBS 7118]|uniref:Potassium ion transporter n=1 Tax=Cryptococcus wingfieldii CBS 7118 TaxID=1295528 RepID=A0A1E3K426_9TREE|nr:potassium ion transporter [Cryptococcus wingfieldii CBS 7118]ODO07626.1 potassium ion transporter [Cryptococcus wingfieldii CBS 7118]
MSEYWHRGLRHLNFFRVHILVFTFTPIIASGIFYAANGSATGNANSTLTGLQKVQYLDCLFMCFSAMTTTGLCTINLSALHPFQQFMLFVLFIIGDSSFVSLIMVLVRKRYFRTHCEQLLANDRSRRGLPEYSTTKSTVKRLKGKDVAFSGPMDGHKIESFGDFGHEEGQNGGVAQEEQVMSDSPVEMTFEESHRRSAESGEGRDAPYQNVPSTVGRSGDASRTLLNTGATVSRADSAQGTTTALKQPQPIIIQRAINPLFDARQRVRRQTRVNSINLSPNRPTFIVNDRLPHDIHQPLVPVTSHVSHTSHLTHATHASKAAPNIPIPAAHDPKNTGMGGFPTLWQVANRLLPQSTKGRLTRPTRRLHIINHPAFKHEFAQGEEPGAGPVPEHEESWREELAGSVAKWLPEGLGRIVVGRNSRFWTEELEDEELEQIGGVEYRALRLLSYLVSSYIFLYQVIPFAVLAIYFSQVHSWDSAFEANAGTQAGTVNKTWFSLFLSSSAYAGCGMVLTDQALIPFQTNYLLIYIIMIGLLVGNHALPIALRFIIWIGTKLTRTGTRNESFHFLLDHPRRCFLYLFPSHQTWYLLFILIAFTIAELLSFLLLNIGLPVLESLGGWERFSVGLYQSLSVRASGFGIVNVASMAPAVLFIYIILMYVAIYPIAMSVRSTNVYEERALGVYEEDDPSTSSDAEPELKGGRGEVFSKYLMWHMRKQLAFDMWPLAAAVLAICVFERGKIVDPEKSEWFTVFRILFECTSAYATIGLTLGTPNNNYAFSGEFGTVSKLIMILVMLRGRHRGLPVAIDRAILLPKEYSRITAPANGLQPVQSHVSHISRISQQINPFTSSREEPNGGGQSAAKPVEEETKAVGTEAEWKEMKAAAAKVARGVEGAEKAQ